jgi:hypothetical protein
MPTDSNRRFNAATGVCIVAPIGIEGSISSSCNTISIIRIIKGR